MTPDQRDSTDNLIALCPTHHRLIDATPADYPATFLQEIKKKHEADILSRLAQAAPPLRDNAVADLSRQIEEQATDFAIVVALPMELDAVLLRFPELQRTVTPGREPRTYYSGIVTNAAGVKYRMVAMLLRSMGNLEAANATHDLIKAWNPRYIAVNGIAGGLRPQAQQYGDVLVAETVVYYELGKEKDSGLENRSRHFPCDPSLLDAARNMRGTHWRVDLPARPDGRRAGNSPMVHFGPLASGEKVVASASAVERLLKYQPDLVGVEMESAGVASAALGALKRIGFIAIRSICDFADHRKSDNWQPYAAASAAAFLRALITEQPVRPLSNVWPTPAARPPEAKPQDSISRRKKLFGDLCRRLDKEELKNFCFVLGVDVDELPGDRKSSHARELILLFERRGKVDQLAAALEDFLNDDQGSG